MIANKTMIRKLISAYLFLLIALNVSADQKKFFNLNYDQVRVDSVLPQFAYSMPLKGNYRDSVYTATIVYPEFIDASPSDIATYNHLSGAALPELPAVTQVISTTRGEASFVSSFCPLVFRNNKYQILVSFMLDIKSTAVKRSARVKTRADEADNAGSIYAAHSILASGKWAKIRVPESGVYQLTSALIKKAGFSNLAKVKIYGYGGNMQPEKITSEYLAAHDDLKEVPTFEVNGKRLFYAEGPVSWSSEVASRRTRNPYSDYGYYFITQSDGEPATYADSASFVSTFYPSAHDYHTLIENDGYSWYEGGRNLFDSEEIANGKSKLLIFKNDAVNQSATLDINVTAGSESSVSYFFNGRSIGTDRVSLGSYDKGSESASSYTVDLSGTGKDTLKVTVTSGGPVRMDYASLTLQEAKAAPSLSGITKTPEYVYNITNQDHHADAQADMVIIIPTSQKLLAQAKRLKEFHEAKDGLRVNIVPADELYNEFSSGTPDANAYRRYLKMLYDRASSEADMPRYLLLFGDCVWDNRMLTNDCKTLSPDDYLLCYESENSFNEVTCYVDDSWYGLLGEGKGATPTIQTIDVAVGRFPVTNSTDAKTMVDKVINYANNQNAGSWQNTIMFMGDDGNDNLHMEDANEVADYISALHPQYQIKKVMWDAYIRESSSTGHAYPEASAAIKKQQAAGALIMDYAGHGRADQISHEAVLRLTDFASFTNKNLPLWITASCDIMPFDGIQSTIGETAVLNQKGGSVAFYGTTRTVYANLNKYINRAFLRRVLSYDSNGKPVTLGEAHRLAQNDLVNGTYGEIDSSSNRLQYSLLGDPALALQLPTMEIVVDSINGMPTTSSEDQVQMKAGSIATIIGHVKSETDFNGVVTATVRDAEETVVCRMQEETSTSAFEYQDRTNTIYNGSDSITDGRFKITFAVPKDISYSNGTGMINLYASNNEHSLIAHGYDENFIVGGSAIEGTDSIGPSIYCYLNSSSFANGGNTNATPFFYASMNDKDGINATGSGIGHSMQLVIDGQQSMTYDLTSNFMFDFGSYTSGNTYLSLPELTKGKHTLQFRAWDVLNNSSTVKLDFNVVEGLEPNLFSVSTTNNPARTNTTFVINHDRMASNMDVKIEVFDGSGRLLWNHAESGVPSSGAYTVNWNLTTNSGTPLRTGVYLYRVGISSDGSKYAQKTQKLIILKQ